MGGRIGFGLLGDQFGAKPIMVIGLLAQAFGALAYVFARGLGEFYTVAAIFGFIYTGVMPLYAVLARETFTADDRNRHRRDGDGWQPRHSAGPQRKANLRRVCELHVALCRLLGDGTGQFLITMTFRPLPRRPT